MKLPDFTDYLQIIISKSEIEHGDLSNPLSMLKDLLKDKKTMENFYQRVDIGISGYDNDRRELFEISEVRKYIQQLDVQFPFWFYFLNSIHGSSLQLIVLSCIECKIESGKTRFDSKSMENFMNSHFVYMNQISDFVGMSDEDNETLTELVLSQFE